MGVAAVGGMAAGSMAGSDAMDEIFGRRSAAGGQSVEGDHGQADADSSLSLVPVTTSSVSVNDYFARRRAQLGLSLTSGRGISGFTLEDQARFAEDQTAGAYSGRRGLGLGRVDHDAGSGNYGTNAWNMPGLGSATSMAATTTPAQLDDVPRKRKHAEALAGEAGEEATKAARKAAKKEARKEARRKAKKEAKRLAKKEARRAAKKEARNAASPSETQGKVKRKRND